MRRNAAPFDKFDVQLLHARIKQVRAKLAILSEAPATRLQHRPEKVHVRSVNASAPRGVREDVDMGEEESGPPPREWGLFEHFEWRFAEAWGNFHALHKVCTQAEIAYWKEIGAGPPKDENTATKDRRIIQEYVGMPAWEVATWEGCNILSVRKLRRANMLDPDTGLEDHGLSKRDRSIIDAIKRNVKYEVIAEEYGITKGRIAQIAAAA